MDNKQKWTNKKKAIKRLIDMHEFNGNFNSAERLKAKLKDVK